MMSELDFQKQCEASYLFVQFRSVNGHLSGDWRVDDEDVLDPKGLCTAQHRTLIV